MGNSFMRILVTGSTGQLGHDVVRVGKSYDFEMIGIGSKDLDITNRDSVRKSLINIRPDAIIHCAAYTAVDKAEDDREKCYNVNVNGTKYLAEISNEINSKFMYISTDYVFDGQGDKPFKETDKPNPIGYYGKTKYIGENIVTELLKKFFIIRVSWVFGINGNNFVKTMLKLSKSNKEIKVVCDQIGSPTYTFDVSKLILEIIQSDKYGIYHATNEGFCSWAEFAKEIFKQSGINVKVNSIKTEEYPTRAVRPKNTRLEKNKLRENGFNPLPTWQDAVRRYLKELKYEKEWIYNE